MRIVAIFLVFCAAALMLLGLFSLNIRQNQLENRRMREYLEFMEQFSRTLDERTELVRKFRHDIAGHIQTLEMLARTGADAPELLESMRDIVKQCENLTSRTYSSDEIVNAVCGLKARQCAERGIPIIFRIDPGSYDMIRETDMAALLQNLLDNAIEANERISSADDRGIRLFLSREAKSVRIKVENKLSQNEKLTFSTRKYPSRDHGIGTRVIRGIAEKYGGVFQYDADPEKKLLRICVTLKADGGV